MVLHHQILVFSLIYFFKLMKLFIFLPAILLGIHLNAQQVYPFGYTNIPKYSYSKDTEKILDPYIGIWKHSFNEKKIIIEIKKEEKVLDKNDLIYKDKLVIRYEIKDKNGKIIESTLGKTFNNSNFKIEMRIFRNDINKLMGIFYGGEKCLLGMGFVYLSKFSEKKISWSYQAGYKHHTMDNNENCEGDINIPQGENLIFVKVE